MNDKNKDFYNNIGEGPLRELAVQGGFDTWKDLEMVKHLIPKDAAILEIGAGYGRCIEFLLKEKHLGDVYALEKSALFDALSNKYNHNPQIHLIKGDVKNEVLPEAIDVALWMWSGIIEFSETEQIDTCKKIAKSLNPGGRLILDIPRIGTKTIATHKDTRHLEFVTQFGTITAFLPDDETIEEIKKQARFSKWTRLDYETTTDKQRTVYILDK